MATAARAYYNSLDQSQRSKGSWAFENVERTRWHWTTPTGFPCNGLLLLEMNQNQRTLAIDLLRASLSANGFQTALSIIEQQSEFGSNPLL